MKSQNEVLSLEVIENQILHAVYLIKEMDIEAAKEALEFRLNFSQGVDYKVIVDATSIKKISKEARDFMGEEKGYEGLAASALIINSPLGAMLANFYMKFSSKPVPTKLFSNIEDAKKWLSSL